LAMLTLIVHSAMGLLLSATNSPTRHSQVRMYSSPGSQCPGDQSVVPQPIREGAAAFGELPLEWATGHDIERRFGPRKRARPQVAQPVPSQPAEPVYTVPAIAADMTCGWATDADSVTGIGWRNQAVGTGRVVPTAVPAAQSTEDAAKAAWLAKAEAPTWGAPAPPATATAAAGVEMTCGWATEAYDVASRPSLPKRSRPAPAPPAELTCGWATENDAARRFGELDYRSL